MTEYKVLVFPAGTEIAFEIHAALRNCKFITLYGATSVPCHADFVFKNCFDNVPFVDDPQLIDALNEIIDDNGIDFVYPAHDSVLLRLTLDQGKLHARVVTSDLATVETCRNKNLTYTFLNDKEYCPKHYWSSDEVEEYPVFIKPSVGQGSEGAMRIDCREDLDHALESETKYAICEYLPGDEYTVDCFTDKNGDLLYVCQRTRERIRSGIAVRSEFVETAYPVIDMAYDLNNRFSFNGAWFFQVKKNAKGEYKLLEVAPRIAGTMGLSRNRGVNLPLLTIYNMLGEEVRLDRNYNALLLDRAFISRFRSDIEYDKVYVDFDDTIIVNGKVNPFLMAVLYQAKDKGKQLFLISRHDGNIYDDLAAWNISPSLFDAIIIIGMDTDKSEFIKGESILIDDSFAERNNVYVFCGIPVFDVDAVESLFDWSA